MKRTIITSLLSLIALFSFAQGGNVQKASKSVFTLTTFKADGSILATTHGVYCGAQGEAIAAFTPFIGASSAVIIDASGKKAEVEALYGANNMYDMCRFKVASKTTTPLPVAKVAVSGKAYAIGYSTKKAAITPLTVKSTEAFKDKYTYYVFNEEINEDIEGCPIVNDNGELVGLVQRSKTTYDIHSTDAKYYSELISTGLASHDPALQKTKIRVALPDDKEQARLMLLMIDSRTDSIDVVNTVGDFNKLFPEDIDGYSAMTRYQVSRGNIDAATASMENAIKNVKDKDEAYYEYAKQMYNVVTAMPDSMESSWNLTKAADLAEKAIAIKSSPMYKHLLAQIKYSQLDFEGAKNIFEEVSESEIANSEIYYEIAQCKSQLGAENKDVIEDLNKAVEKCPKPLTPASAPYFLARGITLDAIGEHRAALKDYNVYDTLMYFRASPDFYYTRFKCEVQLRQFQQALNDIAHAAFLNPGELTYLAEMASLQLRVGRYEDAIKTCNLCLSATEEYADIYIIKGVALARLERKEEAKEAFKKAAELGDPRGEENLKKYQ